MDYDTLIKNWHAKASDEDYFSKFVFEYLAFIAFLKKKKYTNTRQDREAIQKLKREDRDKQNYLAIVTENSRVRGSWNEIIDELNRVRLGNVGRNGIGIEEISWWNCSHSHFDSKTAEERQKTMGVIHGLDDWENMIEFWYSIRNNLFHGSKDPQDKRDQLLIKDGYITLQPLVGMFIENNHQRLL